MLEIKKFNEPILRKKARRVWVVDEEIKEIVAGMVETMKEKRGLGLAAPQVGLLRRIIAVETDYKNQEVLVLVNPKIIKKSREKVINVEGCLSFPNIYLDIKRAKEVVVSGKNIKGEKVKIKAGGILARVFQHEIDHLNGIVFFDRLGIFDKIKFKLKNPSLKV